MKPSLLGVFPFFLVLVHYAEGLLPALAAASNMPPIVLLVWPTNTVEFGGNTQLKIKAQAIDPDGTISEVRFFSNTSLIGVVTNPPYNVIWSVGFPGGSRSEIKAVARDNSGASGESSSVIVGASETRPTGSVVQMIAPVNGSLFVEPATFEFSAEVLASGGGAGPVEFLLNEVSFGQDGAGTFLTATTPPRSITVSNLMEGEYNLRVNYLSTGGGLCSCRFFVNTIRVVKLGLGSPRQTLDGRAQFEVDTSLAGRRHVIETSLKLDNWTPISTNVPSTNAFTFTAPSPIGDSNLFFRVRVPPE